MAKREYGAEHPYVKLGIFKLRFPFAHYRWEWPEAIQGVVLTAVCLGAIAALQATLGIPFELATAMVALNTILYIIHPTFGDPVFPGWITPAIPLVLAYAGGYEEGISRIHSIIALQIMMAILFTFMGITGLADKIVSFVPVSMRSGIILGAGIAAITSRMTPGGVFDAQPITFTIGILICYVVMFSYRFLSKKDTNGFVKFISKYGMLPGLVVAGVIGIAIGELPMPVVEMGITPIWRLKEVAQSYTVFGLGFPPISYFIKALPTMVAAYIIAFGDFVLAEVVTTDAKTVRPDEVIDFNPNRSNLISGFRNIVMGLFAPYAPLCGPLWAGGTIATAERYKHGRDQMDTIFSGLGSFTIAMAIGIFITPLVTLLKPVLPLALALTMIVQGFACGYIAMEMVVTKEERGVSAVMGVILAMRGSAWGLAVGVILHLLIGVNAEAKAKAEAALAAAGIQE